MLPEAGFPEAVGVVHVEEFAADAVLPFLAGLVAAAVFVVGEAAAARLAQVAEAHFLDVYAGAAAYAVALHHKAVVALVGKVGRAVDVVHLYPAQFAQGVAVHLARMGHEDDQAAVLHGKAAQAVQQVRDVLQFGLSRRQLLLQPVQGVDDEDADAPAHHHPAGGGQHVVQRVGFGAGL